MKKLQVGVIGSAGWEEYPNKKPSKKAFKTAALLITGKI